MPPTTRGDFIASLGSAVAVASPLPVPSPFPSALPSLAVYHVRDDASRGIAIAPDALLTFKGVRIEVVTDPELISAAASAIDASLARAEAPDAAVLDARWGLRFSTATERFVHAVYCDALGKSGQGQGRPAGCANGAALIAYLMQHFGPAYPAGRSGGILRDDARPAASNGYEAHTATAEEAPVAIKPTIDLTKVLSRAVASLRIPERIGALPNVESSRTRELAARTAGAKAVTSVCPYCAVGCSTLAYVSADGKLLDVEGNPESPINGGHLCPKGSAIFGLTVNEGRWTTVKYRAPYATQWEDKPLEWALERIAERFKATREKTFVRTNEDGKRVNHTLGIASLGGATFGVEENYLLQ
ncbi:MAG: hypothetical protein IAI49_13515, partial [Candidatus Eremiobacteraeota bacterium]|nr:hypothetical protein [Candidatus Eremiobacteraeota bacterium]